MKLRIQSINFDVAAQLESFIEKKVAKLEKTFEKIESIDVYLKVVKPETAENKTAEIKVAAPGVDFFASKTCDTFEEAVVLAVEALDKQIQKHKDKTIKN